MIKTDNMNYYRLAIYNEHGGAEVTNFMATTDAFAIKHAIDIHNIMPFKLGCILFRYKERNTCGPFVRVATIEEPKAVE